MNVFPVMILVWRARVPAKGIAPAALSPIFSPPQVSADRSALRVPLETRPLGFVMFATPLVQSAMALRLPIAQVVDQKNS